MRQINQQMFSKTLTLASRNFKKVKVEWRGQRPVNHLSKTVNQLQGIPRYIEMFTGQSLQFSWRGPFHFLGNKNSHEFSLFIFLFYQPKSAKLKVDSLLLSCSGREWVNDKRSFDPDIFLLFFLTGFSNFMIVCIDGKLRGSKSPSNSSLNCH